MAKFAFMINSAPGDPAPLANNLEYASNLDEGGHEVAVFFDGQGTQWISELEGNTDSVALEYYDDVRDRGLIGGACGFCASFFEVDEEARRRHRKPRPGRLPTGKRGLSADQRRLRTE
ncbi:hypothetical protein BRC86_03005 [Halobacteriales archaeon QS_3_64_16]|nr:MAG: hypothetical protein BRC86_03005 [Halobacteriales archaeon QS_3_64_16]